MKTGKRSSQIRLLFLAVLVLSLCVLTLTACGKDSSEVKTYEKINDLRGFRVGVMPGAVQEDLANKNIEDVQISYWESKPDMALAIQKGDIDAFICSPVQFEGIQKQFPFLTTIPEQLPEIGTYFGLTKSDFGYEIQESLSTYLKELWDNGFIPNYSKNWMNSTEHRKVDFRQLRGENGVIRLIYEAQSEPFFTQVGDLYDGLEAEILYDYCEKNGYGLEPSISSFAGTVAGITTGKFDMTLSLKYTEERAKTILFTEPYEYTPQVVVIKASDAAGAESVGFFAGIANSFKKNFIDEDRYMFVVRGMGVTVEIVLMSAIFGTLFGALLCLLRRSNNRIVSTAAAFFIRLIQGIPIVVFLLVLFYVIFAKTKLSGIVVGIIAFSIDFGVYTAEILRSGIESVDIGQFEAAYAIGFNKFDTYKKIILPQALKVAIPVYKGQLISMVKMTSVIGYVAVQDLTKASDIIRASTFDPFMPLLVTAFLYFLLAYILTTLIGRIEISFDPEQRRNVLGDVDTNAETGVEKAKLPVSTSNECILRLEHIKKEFENATPFSDVNASIYSGDVIAIIGPSGTGKSTLLRCINRLVEPTSGKVFFHDTEITGDPKLLCEMRKKVGMVFQNFNLFNHLTVIENIMLGQVEINGVSRQQAYENGMSLLDRVGLRERAMNYPSQLSGGQRQRVAIVRVLAMEPEMIMFDEPTSALDPTMIGEVLKVISGLAAEGVTMMIVTHEMKFARDVSNRVFYMDEGGIYEDGSSDQIFNHPKREKTYQFINRVVMLECELKNRDFDFVTLQNDVEQFCIQNMFGKHAVNRVNLVIEEISVNAIRSLSGDCFPVRIQLTYDKNENITMNIGYKGKSHNLMDGLNTLSDKLIRHSASEIEYSRNDETAENTLLIKLNNNA